MGAPSSSGSPHTYLRIVVYCDDSQKLHALPDVRVPRSIDEVRRLIEDRVGHSAKVLSYWNCTRRRYELLRDVRALLQADSRLLSQRPRTSAAEALTTAEADGGATAHGDASSSVDELDACAAEACIYRCQLWMETELIRLEPLDEKRDSLEYDELRRHAAQWLGNRYVSFHMQNAVRIRCPFLTRMFDETRRTRLSDHQEKVQLLYYSNNAWCVRDVLTYGFLLREDVPTSLEAALLSSPGVPGAPSDAESRWRIPAPQVSAAALEASSPSTSAPTTANTLCNPFVFTSSMLGSHVKYASANTGPQKVLLCEVAPGRRFMTDQGLTGESPDKQAFPTPPVKPPRGYDSVCYMRARNQKRSLRTEEAAAITAEDLCFVQVQVQHSYQALPRYLLTVTPSAALLPVQQGPGSERSVTVSPVRAPGTTAQVAAAREDEKMKPAAGSSPLPRPLTPSPKSYNMREWFRIGSRQRSVPLDSGTPHARTASAASDSPQGTRRVLREEVRYADCTMPRQRAASVSQMGRGGKAMPSRRDASNQRHVARQSGVESEEDIAAHDSGGGGGPIELAAPNAAASKRTRVNGGGERLTSSPSASGAYSAGDESFRDASHANRAVYRGDRASSVPRIQSAQHPPFLNPSATQPSLRTNSVWAAKRPASSPRFQGLYNAHSSQNGLLYEGLPRGGSAKSRSAAQPLVPAVRGSGAGGGAGGASAPLPATLHGAPLRPPLLPPYEGACGGGPLSGGSVVGPAPQAALSTLPPPPSSKIPFSQPPAPPATLNHFACGIHPNQIQSLYCTACDELTCPYCASVGAHRAHVVVEAGERATIVRAKAEALHEQLRQWLTAHTKVAEELRAEQARHAARQRRDVSSLQQRFLELEQALHQAEHFMAQKVQEAQCRPPLAEASALVTKCSQALASLDAALRRYHTLAVASGTGLFVGGTRSTASSLPELLHFLRTTPSLICQVRDSFAQHEDEERRLSDAIADYEARTQASEALFADIDWGSLRRLLVSIGSVPIDMADATTPQRSASAGPFHVRRETTSPSRVGTSLSLLGAAHSRSNSATGHVRSQTPTALSSPRRDACSNVPQRLWGSQALGADLQSENGAATSPLSLFCSQSPSTQQERCLHRSLGDLQRGYIWVIQSATSYFEPGQRKTVCSTPFRLLGVSWELRIAPLPGARHRDGGAPSTPTVVAGKNADATAVATSKSTLPDSLEGGGGKVGGGQARSFPVVIDSMQEDHTALATDAADDSLVTVVRPSEEAEAEWLGLFLFPLQHRLRIDFRVIAFSEVTWAEWRVTGWMKQYAGKGWGLYPFLHRSELMRTDKLARDDTVKICIAPISDLY
ncbi:hypothetical protein LSCM1_01997 [Leishmania martiniquensis]|uniref:B box-type domain-containing protein n=1 Tax=Leishmania martiniquensis TaxID=1580590 RepID=A0A836GVT8_9TRYP|nr:hypothetical protein LSCM1_01997 [Leishmania martiniquensis]